MPNITVQELAKNIGITEENLLRKLCQAGLPQKNSLDFISDIQRKVLLGFIRGTNIKKKITLQSRNISKIKIIGQTLKTINIEVRKKKICTTDIEKIKDSNIEYQNHNNLSIKNLDKSYHKEYKNNTKILNTVSLQKENIQKKKEKIDQLNSKNFKIEKKNKDLNMIERKKKGLIKSQIKNSSKVDLLKVLDTIQEDEKEDTDIYQNKKNFFSRKKIKNIEKKNSNFFKKHILKVKIPEKISIENLAKKIFVKKKNLKKKMLELDLINSEYTKHINQEIAALIVEYMGHEPILINNDFLEKELLHQKKIKKGKKISRPPIVTIMGHVDHGKTTLLDSIRNSNIVNNEFGNITQHIGIYPIKNKKGIITFLDTPGHEAFSVLRQHSANIADIIILLIAADDGVMPQTIESIKYIQSLKKPIIIAINKIDKEGVNFKNIKNNLLKYNIIPEEYGGEHICINISAKKKIGIDELIESIFLQAEMMDITSTMNIPAQGIVIESKIDKRIGNITSLIVKNGILKKGDLLVCDTQISRIRLMMDKFGKIIQKAYPSIPVDILGFSKPISSGINFYVLKNEKKAREITNYYKNKKNIQTKNINTNQKKYSNLFDKLSHIQNEKHISIIIKADRQGSIEVISNALLHLSSNKKNPTLIKIISKGIGDIKESDVNLAKASNAIILGFHVNANVLAKQIAKIYKIKLYFYKIIYNLIDDISKLIFHMISPKKYNNIIGSAEVKNVFQFQKNGIVIGCIVIKGIIKKNSLLQIFRDEKMIYKGKLESLRYFKNDVNEVKEGHECGIRFKDYNNIQVGDKINIYDIIKN